MNKEIILIGTNLLTLILLIAVMLREKYPEKLSDRWRTLRKEDQLLYEKNKKYQQEIDLHRVYQKKGEIVMLGNSITHRVQWNELFDRDDILNRGIDDDVTEGFVARLDEIIARRPAVCFIMGGINDLMKGVPEDAILKNLAVICQKLKQHNINPIIQSIFFVGEGFKNGASFNEKIKQTNALLQEWCTNNKVVFIDLNKEMGNPGFLKPVFTNDEVHLTGEGYVQWREALQPFLPPEA